MPMPTSMPMSMPRFLNGQQIHKTIFWSLKAKQQQFIFQLNIPKKNKEGTAKWSEIFFEIFSNSRKRCVYVLPKNGQERWR